MVEMKEACMEKAKNIANVCLLSFFLLSEDVQCYDGCLWLNLVGSAL